MDDPEVNLEVNIEGAEGFVAKQIMPEEGFIPEEDESELEEEMEFESFPLDGISEELELDDFVSDEH